MRKIRSILVLFALMITLSSGYGQNLIADFTFDDCSVTDLQGNYNNNEIRNNIGCDCGVGENSNALYFNGGPDTIFLDNKIKDIFAQDFSMSFHFWVEDAPEEFPIFSINSKCSKDSSFLIRYLPNSKDLKVDFLDNALEGAEFRTNIDDSQCWHHLLFTRLDQTFTLYIDGEFIESQFRQFPPELNPLHVVTVGYSHCIDTSNPNSDVFFRGRLDELQFYDYAISDEEERLSLMKRPDQIFTNDTTIFVGDLIDLVTGFSCAPNIQWTPSMGLDNATIPEPQASPDQTTLYEVEFDYGTCVSRDQISISVVDPDEILCEDILFPSAFTPNGDNLNDRFFISNSFVVESISRFEIYDRWGLKLYESMNKNQGWDGFYKGQKMPIGTYVYKIEYACKGGNYQKTGSFNILK